MGDELIPLGAPDGPVRLPLWKNAFDAMKQTGIVFGASWKADFFEGHLKCARTTDAFKFALMHIREAVKSDFQMYLQQSEGGTLFTVLDGEGHLETGLDRERAAVKKLRDGAMYVNTALTNPDTNLTDKQRRKGEKALDRIGHELMFMKNSKRIVGVLTKHDPKLLKPDGDKKPEGPESS